MSHLPSARPVVATVALLVAGLALLGTSSAAGAGAAPKGGRTFTDQEGREIVGTVLAVDEDGRRVTLRRADGRVFAFEVALLSAADREYIQRWALAQPLRDPVRFQISLKKILFDAKLAGPVVNGQPGYSTEGYYVVTYKNRTGRPTPPLKAKHYNIYRMNPRRAGLDPGWRVEVAEFKITHLDHDEAFSMPPRDLTSRRLRGERVTDFAEQTLNPADPDSYAPSYAGTVVRIFSGGILIQEVRSPEAKKMDLRLTETEGREGG